MALLALWHNIFILLHSLPLVKKRQNKDFSSVKMVEENHVRYFFQQALDGIARSLKCLIRRQLGRCAALLA
jgi:hypothetical protein